MTPTTGIGMHTVFEMSVDTTDPQNSPLSIQYSFSLINGEDFELTAKNAGEFVQKKIIEGKHNDVDY